jgi:hypothetical protein
MVTSRESFVAGEKQSTCSMIREVVMAVATKENITNGCG